MGPPVTSGRLQARFPALPRHGRTLRPSPLLCRLRIRCCLRIHGLRIQACKRLQHTLAGINARLPPD